MSAFLVTTTHIRALVSACACVRYDTLPRPDWRALHARYPDAFAACIDSEGRVRDDAQSRGWLHYYEDELGRALILANIDSLRARYPGDREDGLRHDMLGATVAELLAYKHALVQLPAVTLIKAVHCFDHQACEPEGYRGGWCDRFCDALLAALVRSLPGYEAAPWGVEDPEDGPPEAGTAGAPISILSMLKAVR